MNLEVVEVRPPRALQVAASLAQHPGVEQRRVELRVELQRVVEPLLRIAGAAEAVEGDGVVIRGVGTDG